MHFVKYPLRHIRVDIVPLWKEDEVPRELRFPIECTNTLQHVPKVNFMRLVVDNNLLTAKPRPRGWKCINIGIDFECIFACEPKPLLNLDYKEPSDVSSLYQ